MKANVLGAGSWGTALALLLSRNGHDVTLVGRDDETISALRARRENLRYLPGFILPDTVGYSRFGEKLAAADLWVLAVPTASIRTLGAELPSDCPLVMVAAKGLEAGTAARPSEIVAEVCPSAIAGVLSGPNLAVEIARGVPTVAVSAFNDRDAAEKVRCAFMCRSYRVYVSDDVIGVELAGALKNVLAIGAGMSDGLGFGDNTKAALIARGLFEMARLGMAQGARIDTFFGIAGVGDLFATAVSRLSRNYRVGFSIGQGVNLKEALEEIGQVAEGVGTAEAACILARKQLVEVPLMNAIHQVLHGGLLPLVAVEQLMERLPKNEGLLQPG